MYSIHILKTLPAWRVLVGAALVCAALPGMAGAQSSRDSALYVQAQQMVANGDAAAGRRLADSVANAAPAGSAAFAEGLYWKATLASNARDSEHAYRQIIVDYPLSGRVPDALLRIGQLESARGDNAAALQHFQRLVLEHPQSPLRAEASYWVAQSYFGANDPPHACAANADALANVRASNVELKNRIGFQQQRCRGVALANNTSTAAPVTVPVEQTPVEKPAKPGTKQGTKPDVKAAKQVPVKQKSVATADTQVAVASHNDTSGRATADSQMSADTQVPAKPGVVSRAPTKEEVAKALESADAPTISAAAKAQAERAQATRAAAAKPQTPTSQVPVAGSTAKASTTRANKAAAAESRSETGSYAVQIAAFSRKPPATALMAKLRGRGYNAYIDGTSAPYRVRIGHYPTHAAAAAALVRLKAKQIDGFVAER
jgi:DedD protein